MSCPLEQRGSPVCLPLPPPPPRPTNRIVSLGDSSAGQPEQAPQSSDDSDSSMTWCFPPRWTPVPCCCVGDSDELRSSGSSSCLCSRVMEPQMTRSSCVRPRAQCSRKIVSDRGRKCRHTSCQSVSSVDNVLTPETPVNVIDVLHRDQRTVCVSNSECSDSVHSAKDFKCHTFRSRRSSKCDVQFRFSMQRFCSAVLCGLVLLTALRPQPSMAAPASPSYLTSSKDNDDAASDASSDTSSPDIDQVLKTLKVQTDYTLSANTNLRKQYCEKALWGCPLECLDYVDIGAFRFKKVPKTLGKTVEKDHFTDKVKVDEALQNTYHNFQAYMIALQKIYDKPADQEKNVSDEFAYLKGNIGKLLDELRELLRLRGVERPPEVAASEVADLSSDKSSTDLFLHWGILVEVMNGVEYFSQLLAHLSSRQQSTKL